MRALRERPTQLRRFPDGIEGEQIYQKRVPEKRPDWVEAARVTFPSGRHADELCVTELAQVVWAANLAVIDFHPWPSRRADTEHPDELRIDIDPQPGTDFADGKRVAAIVRETLAEIGYTGWPKTSGNRGIHVACRIEPNWEFPVVRRCALAFAREIERRAPELVTTAWWKEERGEKVFIDYNQNARDRTIASAYSVRARPDATVSAPVTWDELPDVETEDFTLATMPERFAALGDVQAAIDDTVCDLRVLLEWVERDEAAGVGEAPYPPNFPKMPGEPPRVQPSAREAGRGVAPDGVRLQPDAGSAVQQPFHRQPSGLLRRPQLRPRARARLLVRPEAEELRPVAEAVSLHLVVPHLDDELRPHGLLLEAAPAPAVRLGEAPVGRLARAAAPPARRSSHAGPQRPPPSRRSRSPRRRRRGRGAASRCGRGFDFQRSPTTTQSAVRSGFTFTTAPRPPGSTGLSSRFATTPSRPEELEVLEPSLASPTSSDVGDRSNAAASRSRNARRSASGFCHFGFPFQTSTSKAMNRAGISPASRLMRLSAGWRRVCMASKSTAPSIAITISPSSAELGGSCSPSGRSSGK